MKIKNFQKIDNSRSENKIERAKLQVLLLTDGSVIPKRNIITFANTSKTLINRFCNLIQNVYDYKIQKSRISFGKGTKQKLYLVQFGSKEICKDLLKDMTYITSKDVIFPDYWLKFQVKEISTILRNLFDADGGCSLRISSNKNKGCFEIERTVFLSSNNSNLRKFYRNLLNQIGILSGESSGKVTITNKVMMTKFKGLVNFSENVLVGYDSKHWQGIEKRRLLDTILKSYSIPRGYIQRFKTKKEIYDLLASF